MRGRRLAAWALVALLAAALGWQVLRSQRLLRANLVLRQVEQLTVAAAGRVPAALYWENIEEIERARRLDPADSRLPLALGGQYLLLGRPEEAIEAYREALAIEPRPEIYLNLGRAHVMAGDRKEARRSFRNAVLLDRTLRRLVPDGYRPRRFRRSGSAGAPGPAEPGPGGAGRDPGEPRTSPPG